MSILVPLLPLSASAAPYAVVVGANRPPHGRAALRYADRDARAVADVLVQLGGFPAERVVSMADPDPAQVLTAVGAAPADTDILLFYYSGHADGQALFPNGRTLRIDALKRAMDAVPADVRIGILDACSGGGWTGSKGLQQVEPFPVAPALGAGTIYISASTGLENAHELEAFSGSVFTHHWVGGLRGPADADGDGLVTLSESFDWARERTVRDSAIFAGTVQHPSFHYDLRGRQDLVLADLRGTHAAVVFPAEAGEVAVFRMDDGQHVVDLTVGASDMRLVLPPGEYLARRTRAEGVEVAEFELGAGGTVSLSADAFVAVPAAGLVANKGDPVPTALRLAPSRGLRTQTLFGSRIGPRDGALVSEYVAEFGHQIGLTDRLFLGLPGIGLALGRHPAAAGVLLYGGVYSGGPYIGFDGKVSVGLFGALGAGVDGVVPLSGTWSVAGSARASSSGFLGTDLVDLGPIQLAIGAGPEIALSRRVVLRPSAGVRRDLGAEPHTRVLLGGNLRRANRRAPLLQIELWESVWLDVELGVGFDPSGGPSEQFALIGASVL